LAFPTHHHHHQLPTTIYVSFTKHPLNIDALSTSASPSSTIMVLECPVPINPLSDWLPSTSSWFHRRHNALRDRFATFHRHAQLRSSESSRSSPLPASLMKRSQEREAIADGPSRSSQAARSHQKGDSEFGETIPPKTNLNHQQLESRQPSTWSDRQIPAFDISRPVHQLHCGQSGTTWTPGVTIMSSQCTRTGLQNESIRKTALRAVLTRRIGSRSSYLYRLVHFAGIGKSTASHRHQMPTIPKRGTCDQAFQFALPQLVIHP
jgi:hypothetical protein